MKLSALSERVREDVTGKLADDSYAVQSYRLLRLSPCVYFRNHLELRSSTNNGADFLGFIKTEARCARLNPGYFQI